MLQSLYTRILALAASPRAEGGLVLVSFAESSFFPIPPDVLLIPMILARPERAWRLAAICTVASVTGGAWGWLIGFALFDQLAQPVLAMYGYGEKFVAFQQSYQEWGLWIILIKGLTPIPYKIVAIASGAAHFDFMTFVLASVATRGARFFMVAALLHFFGVPIRDFIETRLMLVTTMVVLGIVGGFVALRYLH
ncbi:MAG: DedA family protein [Acetobacteraceae bacterium]|nr:DedA family protein [Acetobacteraceae bacterium]